MATPEDLEHALGERRIATAAELRARLGVSQPTVSRLLERLGRRAVRLGAGRATRYALRREIPGLGETAAGIPLYAIDEDGTPALLGRIHPLAGGGTAFAPDASPHPLQAWFGGTRGDGHFDGLPWFLDDLRPQGFLGRQTAQALARDGRWPSKLQDWNADHVLAWLATHGDDLPGNLVLGDRALNAALEAAPAPVDPDTAYPEAVARALAGEDPGSSAAGEQPKFVAELDTGPAIVKFSPAGDTPDATRWRDLLVAEYWALETLRAAGLPAARAALRPVRDRIYLESARFDRTGTGGRLPTWSLAVLDAEFVGAGTDWLHAAAGLVDQRLLGPEALPPIALAHAFGEWIGNTDMHLGNLSLLPEGESPRLVLAPLYDMTPIALAPVRGELLDRAPATPARRVEYAAGVEVLAWRRGGELAIAFWEAVAGDARVSEGFRTLARAHAEFVRGQLAPPRALASRGSAPGK